MRFLPYSETLVEVTNRTIHGRMLLKPTKTFRLIVLGALGRAQRRYGVKIHAFVFLSNHYHLLASFRDAKQMARFIGYFEAKIAKEVARKTNWRTKIWARRYVDIPASNEEEAQIGRLKYLLANGVKENLVNTPSEWPGAHSVDALLDGSELEGIWYDRTAEYRAGLQRKSFQAGDFAHRETVCLTPLPCWQELVREEKASQRPSSRRRSPRGGTLGSRQEPQAIEESQSYRKTSVLKALSRSMVSLRFEDSTARAQTSLLRVSRCLP